MSTLNDHLKNRFQSQISEGRNQIKDKFECIKAKKFFFAIHEDEGCWEVSEFELTDDVSILESWKTKRKVK
jgi:hypothetical protein